MPSSASEPRWRYAAAAVVMQVVLGVLYAWSVFRGPLTDAYGWSKTETIAPYRYSLLVFAAGMIIAGLWQDRKGPRLVASVGGFLIGTGWLLAAFIGDTPNGLVIAYGCVAGLGVGFAYVTPIATCVKWFPDRRGQVVGLAVMGFGLGPLVFGPLLEFLIGADKTALRETLPRTFLILAGLSYAGVIGAAQFFRVPPAGWRPPGWTPPASGPGAAALEVPSARLLVLPQFWILWIVYFLGTSVGLTAIGEATPLIREMAGAGGPLSAGVALGVMSLFNGAGRLGWGSLSDKLGRKTAILAMFATSIFTCLALFRGATGFWQLLAGLCLAAFSYGGYLALVPSMTADLFGPRHVGANYGLVFTAWGICGFLVPGYFAGIMDRARAANRLAEGYNEIYWTLAALALAGALLTLLLRTPGRNP